MGGWVDIAAGKVTQKRVASDETRDTFQWPNKKRNTFILLLFFFLLFFSSYSFIKPVLFILGKGHLVSVISPFYIDMRKNIGKRAPRQIS